MRLFKNIYKRIDDLEKATFTKSSINFFGYFSPYNRIPLEQRLLDTQQKLNRLMDHLGVEEVAQKERTYFRQKTKKK